MKTEDKTDGVLEHWTPQEVHDAFAENTIVIIDVRTPQEFSFERIEGALLAPLQAFDPNHMPTQDGKKIVFHCGSGKRSSMAAERYLAAGSDRIAHMQGGFAAWKDAGLPYTGTDMATGAPTTMAKQKP